MAPEVMYGQNHSYAADYFAVGVICYELITGTLPYQGTDRKSVKDLMLSKQV